MKAKFNRAIHEVDDYINPGEWFGEVWAIGISCGFNGAIVLVEADNEGDAIDALIDNGKWNHLFVVDEDESEEEWHSFGGNEGIRYDTEQFMFIAKAELVEEWVYITIGGSNRKRQQHLDLLKRNNIEIGLCLPVSLHNRGKRFHAQIKESDLAKAKELGFPKARRQ